jgi:hypothetical protein
MHRFPQARGALPLNTFLSADQADAIEDGNDRVQINGAITLNFTINSGVKNGPTEFCTGGPFSLLIDGSNYCCFVVLPFM